VLTAAPAAAVAIAHAQPNRLPPLPPRRCHRRIASARANPLVFSGMIKLSRVLKVEVGGPGDFAKLGKQAILEKLQSPEEREGVIEGFRQRVVVPSNDGSMPSSDIQVLQDLLRERTARC
jgi:hypothetical protein